MATAEEGGYVQTPARLRARWSAAARSRSRTISPSRRCSTAALPRWSRPHLVETFTFELGKCHEQAIKERELQVLANVDADLCAQVAAGVGLPVPSGSPAADAALSPALSQVVTEPGAIAGRKIGIIADANADLAGIAAIRKAAAKLGATALVIAPVGGPWQRCPHGKQSTGRC